MIGQEFHAKKRIQKEVHRLIKKTEKTDFEILFLDIIYDAQYLGDLIIRKELENFPDKKIKNWPLFLRNLSLDYSMSSPLPVELMDVPFTSLGNYVQDCGYFQSIYYSHIIFSNNKDKLNRARAFCKREILTILSALVIGIDPSLPIEIAPIMDSHMGFNYENEIIKNEKLRESGKLPSPEELLEKFKSLVDS